DPDGAPLYPPHDRDLPEAEATARMASVAPYALRLDMERARAVAGPLVWEEAGVGKVAATPEIWGDVVLARSDVPTSYHLSVVVDDALQGVTDVVRGRDLYDATAVHRLLQKLLGLPAPRYVHHRLVVDDWGRKLAKSAADTGLAELRASGVTPEEVRRLVGLAG